MAVNPMKLMSLKGKFDAVRAGHPKFEQFVDVVSKKIEKDSIVSIKVTLPDGKEIESSIKVNETDMELIKAVKNL